MQKEAFISIFQQSTTFLSSEWRGKYADILLDEHWNLLAKRIFAFVIEGEFDHNPLPFFSEEIIADYPDHYQSFAKLKGVLEKAEEEGARLIAEVIEDTAIESLLVILGQRKTPATITNENGIPPIKEQLLASCFAPYNTQICKAARAREKHISRNDEGSFWGQIKGTPAEKEKDTRAAVLRIIEDRTWWNVFTHYKHDVVFEIRVASGEGIRWKMKELELIGFLEPFIEKPM